jgi:hypothetical protein
VSDEEWPPREARVRAALWHAERRLLDREYVAAAAALAGAFDADDADAREVARGLHHLAAAGYRQQTGERRRALRQLAHAHRRLARFLPVYEEVELGSLLDLVAAELES